MKSKKDFVSVLETMKELLSDTSGIIGTPEERAKLKQYYESERELAKAVAAELENGNEQMTGQKKGTWLQKIKDALRYIFTDKHGECTIPDHILRDLARLILPSIMEMYQSEEGRQQLMRWKAEQEQAEQDQTKEKGESA